MANKSGVLTTFDVLENQKSISTIYNQVKLPDTVLLNNVRNGQEITSTKHYWWDDVRIPTSTTIATDYTAADGVIDLTSAYGLRVGSLLRIGTMVAKVTAVNLTTTVVTITVLQNDTSNVAGVTVEFLNTARVQNSSGVDSDYTQKVERYNVTQIMDDSFKISRTQQKTTQYVNDPGGFLLGEIAKKLKRMKVQENRGLWMNPRVVAATNADPNVAGGLDYFIEANGYTPAGAAFTATTPDNLDTFLLYMKDLGAMVDTIWMDETTFSVFNDMDSSRIRTTFDANVKGSQIAEFYVTKYGAKVKLMVDENCTANSIYTFNTSDLIRLPLKDSDIGVKQLPSTTDGDVYRLLGEITYEINGSAEMGKFTIDNS